MAVLGVVLRPCRFITISGVNTSHIGSDLFRGGWCGNQLAPASASYYLCAVIKLTESRTCFKRMWVNLGDEWSRFFMFIGGGCYGECRGVAIGMGF